MSAQLKAQHPSWLDRLLYPPNRPTAYDISRVENRFPHHDLLDLGESTLGHSRAMVRKVFASSGVSNVTTVQSNPTSGGVGLWIVGDKNLQTDMRRLWRETAMKVGVAASGPVLVLVLFLFGYWNRDEVLLIAMFTGAGMVMFLAIGVTHTTDLVAVHLACPWMKVEKLSWGMGYKPVRMDERGPIRVKVLTGHVAFSDWMSKTGSGRTLKQFDSTLSSTSLHDEIVSRLREICLTLEDTQLKSAGTGAS